MTKTQATPRPTPSLRIQRRDLINIIVEDSARDMERLRREADEAARKAAQAYVDMLSQRALEMARPAIEALNVVTGEVRTFATDIRLEFADSREVRPLQDTVKVSIYSGERYGDQPSRFAVRVDVTPLMRELYKEAVEAQRKATELREAKRMSTYRADAGRALIRQAIAEMPEGEALLEMMKNLRRAVEAKSGKPLLLTEPEKP